MDENGGSYHVFKKKTCVAQLTKKKFNPSIGPFNNPFHGDLVTGRTFIQMILEVQW